MQGPNLCPRYRDLLPKSFGWIFYDYLLIEVIENNSQQNFFSLLKTLKFEAIKTLCIEIMIFLTKLFVQKLVYFTYPAFPKLAKKFRNFRLTLFITEEQRLNF